MRPRPGAGRPAGTLPARLRWLGLLGGLLLAAAAFLAGAGAGPAPADQAAALWGDSGWFRLGLLVYLAGFGVLAVAWWRLGRLLRGPAAPGPRWVLVTGAWWAAPLLLAPPLGSRDVYAYACQGAGWLAGHDPYAVGVADSGCPWLPAVPELWQETTAPYGPLALLVAAGAVAVAQLVTAAGEAQLLVAVAGVRAGAVAGALLLAAAAPRLARRLGVPPASAAWLGAVTPLVAVHAVSGGHNDALVAGLTVVALAALVPAGPAASEGGHRWWALAGGWWALAGGGLAVGLAVAVKVTAVAVLPFALLLGLRRGVRGCGLVAAAAGAGFGGFTVVTGLGVGWWRALADTGALVQWSSPPSALGMTAGYLLRGLGVPEGYDPAVTVVRAAGVAALAVLAVVLWVQARRLAADPRAVVVRAGAVLAAVVLLGPVVYPWYALPALAVLAVSVTAARVRSGLAVATLVLTGLTLPSGLGVPVLTKFPGALLVSAGMLGMAGWWLGNRRRWPAGDRLPDSAAVAARAPSSTERPEPPSAAERPQPPPGR